MGLGINNCQIFGKNLPTISQLYILSVSKLGRRPKKPYILLFPIPFIPLPGFNLSGFQASIFLISLLRDERTDGRTDGD